MVTYFMIRADLERSVIKMNIHSPAKETIMLDFKELLCFESILQVLKNL